MSNEIKRTKEKKIIRYIFKILELIVFGIIIIISAIIIKQRISNNEESFFGYRMFRVQTGSMVPEYNVGDVILVKEKAIEDIQIGDDLVYVGKTGEMNGKMVTHQVIKKELLNEETVFYTKGVANLKADEAPVAADQISGTVVRVLPITTFITWQLSNKYIMYFIFILPLTLYIFFTVVSQKLNKIKEIERNTKNNGAKED